MISALQFVTSMRLFSIGWSRLPQTGQGPAERTPITALGGHRVCALPHGIFLASHIHWRFVDGWPRVAAPAMASNSEEKEVTKTAQSEDSDTDDAEEVLEESPDKRWSKRREQVKQRDVPGIDSAYLAMDNDTGNEVVWNEVLFSERKNFREQEAKINATFDNLTQLAHPNLVKFHTYWTDSKSEKPRIVFITEFMSSGAMALFLQRTRKSGSPLSIKAWKKWTTQILSALNYLHTSSPPIMHGNLTCHTIFIQQNGLIKIGCVAPDAIHLHVKTCRQDHLRNVHYLAPEFESLKDMTPASDIYSFGICALEIAAAGGLISSNGATDGMVSEECIRKALNSLEDPLQKQFIACCLDPDPKKRPTARKLLFHPVLYEVHPLKLLAAHVIVNNRMYEDASVEMFRVPNPQTVAASCSDRVMSYVQLPHFQFDLDKFLEDVRNGIYPLTAYLPVDDSSKLACKVVQSKEPTPEPTENHKESRHQDEPPRISKQPEVKGSESASTSMPATSQEKHDSEKLSDSDKEASDEGEDNPEWTPHETRSIVQMKATLIGVELSILLKLEDGMNRHLIGDIEPGITADVLVEELISGAFISETDEGRVRHMLDSVLHPPPPDDSSSVPTIPLES
ncbi:unnamed protein product, partial [Mesorhabditis spiculigera]